MMYAPKTSNIIVAPHAGAWIEIATRLHRHVFTGVAPHAGAWIEIAGFCGVQLRVCVAPHAGAWIEMSADCSRVAAARGRAPRGRVD